MNVIITGSSGMVGRGVLLECIKDERIENILLINRRTINQKNPKIKEILLSDFKEIENIKDQFKNYEACFHCMGVSSSGISEKTYFDVTFNISQLITKSMISTNPDMIFNYVSGSGTDSTEKGNVMWARVKGKTENMILNMGFQNAYAFRPGVILPEKGVRSKTKLYNNLYSITKPLFPIFKLMKSVTTTSNIGKAMINSCFFPQSLKHLEGNNINELAKINLNRHDT